jgi:hypothetical protein
VREQPQAFGKGTVKVRHPTSSDWRAEVWRLGPPGDYNQSRRRLYLHGLLLPSPKWNSIARKVIESADILTCARRLGIWCISSEHGHYRHDDEGHIQDSPAQQVGPSEGFLAP